MDPTFIKPRSRFGGAFFSNINVSPSFARTFLSIKYMCHIFKDCRKAFDEKRDKNRRQIKDLVE